MSASSSSTSNQALKKLFWAAGGALFLIGLAGWYDRLANGHMNTNYGSVVPWGLWVAVYIYFIGLSAGAFLISSLVYVFNMKQFESIGRLALFTAVVTLLLALLSIWADLGHQFRAWHVLIYPNFGSPMAWMIWLYAAYFLLVAIELWFVLRRDLVIEGQGQGPRATLNRILSFGSRDASAESSLRDRQIVRILATIGIPLAIMFHGGVGSLFAVVAARPAWHGALFPILFLLSALASGGALLIVASAIFQDGWRRHRETILALGGLVLGLLLLDLLFQVSEFLVGYYSNAPGETRSLNLIVSGPFWWVFSVWQLGVGTLIPVVLLVLPRTRKDPRLVSFAGLLIAFGFLAVRLNIVIPGLASEQLRGISQALDSSRLSVDYVPSLTEWLLSAGVVGLGLLLFGVGEWFLPRAEVADTQEEALNVAS